MSARSIFIFGSLFSLLIILPFPTVFYYLFRVVLFALFIFCYFWAKEKVDKKASHYSFSLHQLVLRFCSIQSFPFTSTTKASGLSLI